MGIGSALAGPAGAQTPASRSDSGERVITGRVIDELTGLPVPGAAVHILGGPGVLADSEGRFRLDGLADEPYRLTVRQFGYMSIDAMVRPPPYPDVLFDIPLAPSPVAVEGITAVVDRLATMNRRILSRRNAAPVTVSAFDQERLMRSGAPTVTDFLLQQASVNPVSCMQIGASGPCFLRRGRVIRPRVYIDEMPTIDGLVQLGSYAPRDIYLIEVYAGGQEVRAYTYPFMERMARRPIALIPYMR
jgi:hypothetical protein